MVVTEDRCKSQFARVYHATKITMTISTWNKRITSAIGKLEDYGHTT